MTKIVKATDYGYRRVIRVCLNPDAPEFIHDDVTPHPSNNPNGCPTQTCQYNWEIREFVWSGEEMYTTTSSGRRRRKTSSELVDEIKSSLTVAPIPAQIPGLVGLTLE